MLLDRNVRSLFEVDRPLSKSGRECIGKGNDTIEQVTGGSADCSSGMFGNASTKNSYE
jgi:hypothetical protein